MKQKEIVLEELKTKGFRITKQRKLIIDILEENECSSCKEIYYKALKSDPTIGMATVYRMLNTLEDLGVINRRVVYKISHSEK